jgi:4-amino-4-deoxychorismate lyase
MAIYREQELPPAMRESVVSDHDLRSLNFNVKSNNYLLRSYIATESKSQGGYLAIEADHDGYLLEGSVATVAVLLGSGDFIVPPFDRRLAGTTAIKIMDFIEDEVIPQGALQGYLTSVVRREIKITEAQAEGVEVMFLGGEECVPVLQWDGRPVGDGKKGPAATLFQEYLSKFSKDEDLKAHQI